MDVNTQYGYDDDEKCGKIHIADKTILVDIHDLFQIINYPKGFIHYDNDSSFPYFWSNKQKISYLEFLYTYMQDESEYVFKNGNPLDIRRQNIDIVHHKHDEIMKKYNVIKYTKGHYVTNGKDARKMKNPLWYVINSSGNTSILMYCERDTIVELCELAYEKICKFEEKLGKKITFSKQKNGYIQSSNKLYIHQIISGCYGNGKGTKKLSVDHIDRDPLNNRCDNLRIVENEIQQKNRKGILKGTKRARKQSARALPDDITQDMLEKYVVYYHECYNKEKQLYREFFKVEKHPKLDKIWITSKSNKISVQEKLKKANRVVLDLGKGIYPGTKNENENTDSENTDNVSIFKSLPKYVSFRIVRNKPCLIFEKRILEDGEKKRFSLNYSFQTYPKTNDELSIPLGELCQKVKTKYNIEL
jgi:hypothetical protein